MTEMLSQQVKREVDFEEHFEEHFAKNLLVSRRNLGEGSASLGSHMIPLEQ